VGGAVDYDVVIVGASTAGLLAAELLASGGKKVGIFERGSGLSQEERTYIITSALYKVIPDFPSDLIRHKTGKFQIHAADVSSRIYLSSPDLVLDKKQIIQKLADKAKVAGVQFNFRYEFLRLETTKGQVSPCFSRDGKEIVVATDHLIGADGFHSKVRTSAGLKPLDHVPLLQAEIELPDQWDDNITRVWFFPDETPYFYWLIPDKNRQAVVGLITEKGKNIHHLLDNFLDKNGLEPLKYQYGQAAMYSQSLINEVVVDNLYVYLIGDAAGQVKVTTIGGTITGFHGARAVAAAIQKTQPLFKTFKKNKKELDLHFKIRSLLNQMSSDDYGVLLSFINPKVKAFLHRYNRDEMKSHFWKLAIIQPRFIPLGLKLMNRSLLSKTSQKDDSALEERLMVP
jgi:flavin-dependent dehydrogenase